MWDVFTPKIRIVFGIDDDGVEGALLAPESPSFCNEGAAGEIGIWDVIDDCVDELLGK